jgi:hypothetical protein
VTIDGLKTLSNCRRINSVNFGMCRKLTDIGTRHLSPLMPIRNLQLYKFDLGDAALEWISQFKTIEELEIQEQKWTDRGIAAVARIPKLRYIAIDHSAQVTDAALEALQPASRLERISVSNCGNVSAAGLSRFLEAHPALSVISMRTANGSLMRTIHRYSRSSSRMQTQTGRAQCRSPGCALPFRPSKKSAACFRQHAGGSESTIR